MRQRIGIGGITVAAMVVAMVLQAGCAGMEEDDPALDESFDRPRVFTPIIFVQACPPPGLDYPTVATLYQPLIDFLKSKGYPAARLDNWIPNTGLPVCYSTEELAYRLAYEVQRVRAATYSDKVDIFAASAGALTARYYMSVMGGHRYVRRYVAMAGTDHGTELGEQIGAAQESFGAPNYEQAKELFPTYACAGQTFNGEADDVQLAINGCLTATRRTVTRDETPGSTIYLTIRNLLDDQVLPNESSCLNQRWKNDCASSVNTTLSVPAGACPFAPTGNYCPSHIRMVFDAVFMQKVYDFLGV